MRGCAAWASTPQPRGKRGSAAEWPAPRTPHLPPVVVDLLAHDDRVVRLFLTESCEVAPAILLPEVRSWWSGFHSFQERPRNHPDFPRHDLLRFAEDPDPRKRILALDDPGSCAALAERRSYNISFETTVVGLSSAYGRFLR